MDKKQLYDQAKEAYYNGEPIMTDLEFDELEKELGLENQGYVGTHHQKSYTVKHPFIMGSLSKVQIKEDDNHNIDWNGFQEKVMAYLRKSNGYLKPLWFYEVTPKYDGCSFEVVIDPKGNLVSVSTRGDGEWGKDIRIWFENEWKTNYEPYVMDYYRSALDEQSYFFLKYLVIRGECLVKKSVFMDKYSDEFTMPRSFVAGCLGQDWEDSDKQKEMRDDLSWVAYDFREVYENGTIIELGYTERDREHGIYEHILGNRPDFIITGYNDFDIQYLYNKFEIVRKKSEFALDGFVVKPGALFRLQDGGRARQEDCVAVKYLPEIVDAELIDVEWNVGKTGEYYPTGILADVILGGKNVNAGCLACLKGDKASFYERTGYKAETGAKYDFNYVARHEGKKTEADIHANGVMYQDSYKLMRQTIDFLRGCSESKGAEREEVLLMDENLVNKSIPLILCKEEDVEGEHGASIGKISDEILFYLRARGLSDESIYDLMANGKILTVISEIDDAEYEKKLTDILVGETIDEE